MGLRQASGTPVAWLTTAASATTEPALDYSM